MIMPAGQFQVPVILEARQMGLKVLAIDRNSEAPGLRVADFAEVVDPSDVGCATELARKYQVTAVMSVANDPSVVPAALIAERLGLPGIPSAIARLCRSKRLARLQLLEALPQYCPPFRILSPEGPLLKSTSGLPFPLVLKPTDSNGSRGVVVVDRPEDLENGYQYARNYSQEGLVIAEEFLRGRQVSIETLSYNGNTRILGIIDKTTTSPPFCVVTGHTIPTVLSKKDSRALELAAREIVDAFELKNSPCHLEMCLTEKGPKLLDIGARLSGGGIASHLLPLSTGINAMRAAISIALGMEPEVEQNKNSAAAIRFLTPPAGKVDAVLGLRAASDMPSVLDVVCKLKPGDMVQALEHSARRVGYVLVRGTDREDAANNARRALDTIKISVS